jgi:hypothetical protein
MFRPVRLTRNGPVTTADMTYAPTRRLRPRCVGPRVQEMAWPRAATVGWTLKVCQQLTGNGGPRGGDREPPSSGSPPATRAQTFRQQSSGVRSRLQSSSSGRGGRVIAVVTPQETECDK